MYCMVHWALHTVGLCCNINEDVMLSNSSNENTFFAFSFLISVFISQHSVIAHVENPHRIPEQESDVLQVNTKLFLFYF